MLKNILKESYQYSDYPVGHYTTSDEVPHEVKFSKNASWGFAVKLQNGRVVSAQIAVNSPDSIYGWVGDGGSGQQFKLTKNTSSYYTTFKKKIEDMFDSQFMDDVQAKNDFKAYVDKTFR